MGMPSGIGIVDTMIGFPADDFKMYDFIREQLKDGVREVRLPRRIHVQERAEGAVRLGRSDLDHAARDGSLRRRDRADRRRRRRQPQSAETASGPLHRAGIRRPQQGHGGDPRHGAPVRGIRRAFVRRVQRRLQPAGRHRRRADVSDLREMRRTRRADLLVRRRARAAFSDVAAGSAADRPGDVRLSRTRFRHAPRLRTVGRPRDQADAEVAEPVLLDVRVRAEALPESDRRLREHARRRQDHLRGLFPDGTVARTDHDGHAERAVQGRGLAEVPARQRAQGAEARAHDDAA